MANPILTFDATIISPGIDLRITGAGTPNITASYTDRTSETGTPPATDMAYCDVSISYGGIHWVVNNDGSVTVSGEVLSSSLVRTSAWSGTPPYTYDIWSKFNGGQTFSVTVGANQGGTWNLNIPGSFSVTVPPRTTATTASIHFYSRATGYTYDPDEFTVGLIIENPNYPDYRPGKIWDGSAWVSHNRSAGFEKIYTSSSATREMRTQDGGEGTGNPPTIYNSAWKNQRKIGNE